MRKETRIQFDKWFCGQNTLLFSKFRVIHWYISDLHSHLHRGVEVLQTSHYWKILQSGCNDNGVLIDIN